MTADDRPHPRELERTAQRPWWILAVILFGLLMNLTGAQFTGDSRYYAYSIDERLHGRSPDFIEFGHLFWRPLGLVTYRAFQPALTRLVGGDQFAGIVASLVGLNWVFGLLALLGMYRLALRMGACRWAAWLATFGLCISFGFLNFAHAGSSYIPGLACLILSLMGMAGAGGEAARSAPVAGVALACAVGFWTPYVLAIPMALAFPLLRFGAGRPRWRYAALTTLSFVLAVGLCFGLAIFALGIRDVAGVRSWVGSASHGIKTGGLARMVFGIPRSFIDMGNDGVVFKRYLLHDPYAPVSLAELVRLGFAKLGLFYLTVMASLAVLSLDRPGRRVLALLALGAGPNLVFAVAWQGGDIERYFPVYPIVFAAWALVLGGSRTSRISRVARALVIALFLVMTLANLSALSASAVDRRMKALDGRTSELLSEVGSNDLILAVNRADDVLLIAGDLELRHARKLRILGIVAAGYEDSGDWKKLVSGRIRDTWDRGGTAWVSARAFQRTPEPDWGWIEGDDRRLSWGDLSDFFRQFDRGPTLGGDDGFTLLPRSLGNEARLRGGS